MTCAPVFFHLWGWLQKELGDPFWGEPDYRRVVRDIEDKARQCGTGVFQWILTPFGGVQAVLYDPKKHGAFPREVRDAPRLFAYKGETIVLKTMFDDPALYRRLTGHGLPAGKAQTDD